MHDLDPVFSTFSHSAALQNVATGIGLHDPKIMQSMYIFKQPRIGGEVNPHQDATFLYTEPVSVVGFWFALEDADAHNGAMLAIPGSHKGPLRQRFHYDDDQLKMETLSTEPFAHLGEICLEVPKGTLILLNGLLPHRSTANTSQRSRHAYTLHAIDGNTDWRKDNWIQRPADMPVRGFI
jgi:phytanoyl-CoA hydroxylase